jgi:hypothetical protein
MSRESVRVAGMPFARPVVTSVEDLSARVLMVYHGLKDGAMIPRVCRIFMIPHSDALRVQTSKASSHQTAKANIQEEMVMSNHKKLLYTRMAIADTLAAIKDTPDQKTAEILRIHLKNLQDVEIELISILEDFEE